MSNYIFRNNIWKENTTDMVVPSNSRPFHNLDANTIPRTSFKANPIKHWRKQLLPHYETKSSKQVRIQQLDAPGTGISVNSNNIDCTSKNVHILKENITLLNQCNGIKVYLEDGVHSTRCIGGTNHIRRSANTNISKNYHRNYHSYLKSKCRTYEENARLGVKNDDGTYKSSKCSTMTSSDGTTCNKPIIYKPSNNLFSIQGATSSSANILRKKHDTINKNNASLKETYKNGIVSINNVYDTESGTGYHLNYIKGDTTAGKCNLVCKKELNSIRNKKTIYS
tara:strand:- start:71 stop:913 length:843 start_codon:yes stop_codon:yes gene_type:complete